MGGTNLGGRLTTTNRNIVLDPTSWSNALRRSVSLLQIQIVFLPLLVSIISTSIVGCKSTIVQHSEFPPSFIGSWNWIEAWVEGAGYNVGFVIDHMYVREAIDEHLKGVVR